MQRIEKQLTFRVALLAYLLSVIHIPSVDAQSATLDPQGVHVPSLSNSQRDQIQSPIEGHLIYNFEAGCYEVFRNSSWTLLCGNTLPTDQLIKLDSTGGFELNGPLVVGHQSNNFKWIVTTGPNFNANIELRHLVGAGIPYIDFSGNETTDFDARIILLTNDLMQIDGAGLNVEGTVQSNGMTLTSDQRFKTDIIPIPESLSSLLKIKGYYYDWKVEEFKEKGFSDKRQIGFIAQELEQIFPELVHTDADGYKAVDYARMTPILLEAIKEQQTQFQDLQTRKNELRAHYEKLEQQYDQALVKQEECLMYQSKLKNKIIELANRLSTIKEASSKMSQTSKENRTGFMPNIY